MRDSLSPDLLARYLSGDAGPEVRAQVERWAAADPRNADELARLSRLPRPRPTGEWNLDRAWGRVVPQLADPPASRWRPLALAAGVLVVAGALLVWRLAGLGRPGTPVVIASEVGERREATLPDGTRLVLAPGTTVTPVADYGSSAREVTLVGEAWFEVHHDATRPFRVRAGGSVTEDLGTSFAIRARPGEAEVRVVLVSGRAEFRAGADPAAAAVLTAGMVGRLAEGTVRPVVETPGDVAALVSWREGRLEFVDATLAAVAAELSRWYAVQLVLADSGLGARRITHTFSAGNLPDALDVLRLSLGVRVDRQGDVVTLHRTP